jgi:hypothetical protein
MATKAQVVPDQKCTVRVVQVRRNPCRSDRGIMHRPRVIREVVSAWYHRCQWCQAWFKPTRNDQRYCGYRCRHSAFRDRRKRELEELRTQVRFYEKSE